MNALIIFAKAPVAGKVNTRLIPSIGIERATALQQELVCHRMQQFGHADDYAVELWCAPDSQHVLFQQCQHDNDIVLQEQMGADLGERMLHAFKGGLQRYNKVVLIGTDAPAVDEAGVSQAFKALDDHQVVIAPAEDGGYVLIAMNQAYDIAFQSIEWGSAKVLSKTRDNIIQHGISYFELATCWDIDRPEDLERYRRYTLSV